MTACYGMPFDFIAFFGNFHIDNWQLFMFEAFYLHQTFSDSVSDYYT